MSIAQSTLSLSQRTSISEQHWSRAISDLFAKKFLQCGIPRLLLNAVEGESREPNGPVAMEKVCPDSVSLHSVSLLTRRQKGVSLLWPAGLTVKPAAVTQEPDIPVLNDVSLVGDLSEDSYWIPDWKWRDNRFTIRGQGALERLYAYVKGPGALYQTSYRFYCTFAALSMLLCFGGLMTILALFTYVHPMVLNRTLGQTESRREAISQIGVAASVLLTGAIVSMFIAHLIKALIVHSFAIVKQVVPTSNAVMNKPAGSTGPLNLLPRFSAFSKGGDFNSNLQKKTHAAARIGDKDDREKY